MGNKIKETQYEDLENTQGRDSFETPNYGTRLLLPFIPKNIKYIWECASGNGKISNILSESGKYEISNSDLKYSKEHNFLTCNFPIEIPKENSCIITNPPFSLKRKFYNRCKSHGVPFALLIPADYSGWIIDALRFDNAEKLIPTRRIDYITPTGLSGANGHTSNFHSLWLTWGFRFGKTETFVELTNEMKKDV
jgi:hypothetical protein